MDSKTGRSVSSVASEPEYMIDRVALTAPLTPPEMGASTYSMPCSASSACTRTAAAVPMVE